jgi:hypothetical protein
MSRDPSKLKVFHLADELIVEVYRRFDSQLAEAIDRAPAPEARGLRSEALATPNLR